MSLDPDLDLLRDFFDSDRLLDLWDSDLVLLLDRTFFGDLELVFLELDRDRETECFDLDEDLEPRECFDLTGDGDCFVREGDRDRIPGELDFLSRDLDLDVSSRSLDNDRRRGDLEVSLMRSLDTDRDDERVGDRE